MLTEAEPADRKEMTYRIRNVERPETQNVRTFQVYATPEEIARFAKEGYLVRERFFTPPQTQTLKDALDEIAAQEIAEQGLEQSS